MTGESRDEAQQQAVTRGQLTLGELREARGAQRKRLRGLELGKLVGPDDLVSAQKGVEKRNEGAVAEVLKMVDGCRMGLAKG